MAIYKNLHIFLPSEMSEDRTTSVLSPNIQGNTAHEETFLPFILEGWIVSSIFAVKSSEVQLFVIIHCPGNQKS